MKLTVSEKHIGLRIALTAVAFVIAVVAFTYGVTRIGHKDPGYHNIEAKVAADTILMNKAVTLKYWFDGKPNAIKQGINAVTEVYSPVLSAAYRELDHQNTHDGVVSIATLNQNQGQEHHGKEDHIAPVLQAPLQRAVVSALEGIDTLHEERLAGDLRILRHDDLRKEGNDHHGDQERGSDTVNQDLRETVEDHSDHAPEEDDRYENNDGSHG